LAFDSVYRTNCDKAGELIDQILLLATKMWNGAIPLLLGFQDYGEETEGLNVIQEYVKSH